MLSQGSHRGDTLTQSDLLDFFRGKTGFDTTPSTCNIDVGGGQNVGASAGPYHFYKPNSATPPNFHNSSQSNVPFTKSLVSNCRKEIEEGGSGVRELENGSTLTERPPFGSRVFFDDDSGEPATIAAADQRLIQKQYPMISAFLASLRVVCLFRNSTAGGVLPLDCGGMDAQRQ